MGSPAVPILGAIFFLAFGTAGVAIDRTRVGYLRDPVSIPTQCAGEAPHNFLIAGAVVYFIGVVCACKWQGDEVRDIDGGQTGIGAQVLGYGIAHAVGALVVANVAVDPTRPGTIYAHLAGVVAFELFGLLYAVRCTANAWNANDGGLAGFRVTVTCAMSVAIALGMLWTRRAQEEATVLADIELDEMETNQSSSRKTNGLNLSPIRTPGSRGVDDDDTGLREERGEVTPVRTGSLAPIGSPQSNKVTPARITPTPMRTRATEEERFVAMEWIEGLARCQLVMCVAFALMLASAAGDV